MALEPIEILNGTLSIIVVIIGAYVGIIIASKYFEYKRREFLLVGITGILLCEPWWPSAISFILASITGEGLPPQIYFLIGNVGIPIAILLWLTAFTDLLYKEKQKKIQIIFAVYGILFEIIFFSLLIIDYTLIGELQGAVDVEYRYFVMGYLVTILVLIITTGSLFALESMRSENPEIQLKGKLQIIGFVSFVIGAALDSAIPLNPITLPITRFILISSAIELYGGFILPDWMKKIFLKD